MSKQLKQDFIDRIKQQFIDSDDFINAINTEPFYSVRLNIAKTNNSNLSLSDSVLWCSNSFYIKERPNYTLNPKFHAGAFYPQEASSMYLEHVLKNIGQYLPDKPIVLDLCAAPGGKTTLLTSYLNGNGVIIANEYIRNRAWILRENVIKWGFHNVIVTNNAPSDFASNGAMFDLVQIDAPCSGEGMFRKDDVAIEEWSIENARSCAERQRSIISDIWDAVVEGGIIIYSTCTFNPDENEHNMQWIANEFDVEFINIPIVDNCGITTITFNQGEGYGFYPHKVRGEGFFICAMRKLSGKTRKNIKDKNKAIKATCNTNILRNQSNFYTLLNKNKIIAFRNDNWQIMNQLCNQYNTIWCGLELGENTRKEFIPSPEIPLSIEFNRNAFPTINLSTDEALHYLHGEWTCKQNIENGWNTIQYDDCLLGFVKAIGNRINNYYPKEWRIRMQI